MLNFKSQIVTSFNENCYIVWCDKSKEAVLVDPGGEPKKIYQLIKLLNVSITKILLTHGHIDHVGAAVFFSKLYNIPIIGPHIFDQFLLKNLFSQSRLFNINPEVNAFIPNQWLKDNDLIILGSNTFEVIYCPGHSPGHIAFWNVEKKCLISGDILFENAIGRTDLLGGDEKKIKFSLMKKIFPLFNKANKEVSILPGHGKKFLMNQEYINFIFKTYLADIIL